MRFNPSALAAGVLALCASASGQQPPLPPATRAAIEARAAEVARQAKAETDAAIAKRNAGAMPDRLRIAVGNVVEQRTALGSGMLSIPLTIFTEDIPAGATVRAHRIVAAADNLDRPLVPSTNPTAGPVAQLGAARARGGASAARTLVFQAPPRKAESIRFVEGEIDFIVPTSDAAVTIAAIGGFAGKIVEHATLAKNGVEITSLTREMLETLRPTWGTSMAATGAANFNASAFFLVKDPGNRLVSLEIRDAAGQPLQRGTAQRTTNAVGVLLVESQIVPPGNVQAQIASLQAQGAPIPPQLAAQAARGGGGAAGSGPLIPADAQLHIVLATPESIKTYPFRLENIALP